VLTGHGNSVNDLKVHSKHPSLILSASKVRSLPPRFALHLRLHVQLSPVGEGATFVHTLCWYAVGG
jgi:hypothetical protein